MTLCSLGMRANRVVVDLVLKILVFSAVNFVSMSCSYSNSSSNLMANTNDPHYMNVQNVRMET